MYFLDDFNMPEVDSYGTVQPHTLIRQHLDYNHWYDRNKLTPKDIHNVQYIACMNPTAGSFTINPRWANFEFGAKICCFECKTYLHFWIVFMARVVISGINE